MTPTTQTEPPSIPPPPPFALFFGPDGPDEMDVDLDDPADEGDEDHDQGEHECTGFDGPPAPDDDDDGDDECPRPRARRPLAADTWHEGIEYLGSYPTVQAYMRAQLEDCIMTEMHWLLDCLDWSAVQRRWESDGSRLLCERGQIYKIGGAAQPDPDPDDDRDPCGPWMPTRGE